MNGQEYSYPTNVKATVCRGYKNIEVPPEPHVYDLCDLKNLPDWLHQLIVWGLRKLGAKDHPPPIKRVVNMDIATFRFDGDDFAKEIYRAFSVIDLDFLQHPPDCLLVGPEEQYRLFADSSISYYGDIGKFAGMTVVCVPWMSGILPISLRQIANQVR